ncbi:hypothetical protein CfE428DRAFT_4899 [Chthoniobacter flavus Ellin428]|uniref:Uncharacterized protein n=1 Tax=Chthoniobacter flavus Ellin428 TaxID=497964 RepID=B4D7I4_9BACT|nr:hypothetical protein [Chthoniobacter flavus]EDY17601.1 hypothetical protein CfE428DRAFT_4899 [Chthoniobacter flavus Ellin428]TCO92370.1 hypothetical protein EV701_106139 [Chthoniobacter flavus]
MPYQLLLMAPRTRRVLGLPAGSIRALLTLMTVGFIIVQTARGRRISLLWFESLIIVLAHYFAHRRFVALSPALIQKLTAEDLLEDEPHPLFLPRHSLRTVIVLAFVALAIYLGCEGRLRDPVGIPVLVSVGSYFLGIGFGAIATRFVKGKPVKGASWFDDLKAIITLLAVALAIAVQLFNWQDVIPYSDKLEALPLALMLFYFGSR